MADIWRLIGPPPSNTSLLRLGCSIVSQDATDRLSTSCLSGGASIASILEQPLADRRAVVEQWVSLNELWLAEDNTVLGFAVTRQSNFGNEFVEFVQVLPSTRRRGVASGLLTTVGTARRSPKLFTSTNLSNQPMQRVLAKVGWRSAGIVDGLAEGDPELFYLAPPPLAD